MLHLGLEQTKPCSVLDRCAVDTQVPGHQRTGPLFTESTTFQNLGIPQVIDLGAKNGEVR